MCPKLMPIVLESRDCPATLVTSAAGLVAGIEPFPGYGGPVEIAAAGPVLVATANKVPHVKVYVGEPGAYEERASFYAYDPAFNLGINVATDGDRIATGTDAGAPHVREFDLHGVEVGSFFQGSPDSLGGVRVAYFGRDDSPVSIRPEARTQIYLDGASANVVRGVADLFEAFDVGVTNRYPDIDPRRIATVIFGGSSDGAERGMAIIGGFFQQSEFTSLPARVFSDGLSIVQQVRATAHEAAHLFGAVHVPDPSSIMFEGLSAGRGRFDPLSVRILGQRLGFAAD
jgi:hypothetical protein